MQGEKVCLTDEKMSGGSVRLLTYIRDKGRVSKKFLSDAGWSFAGTVLSALAGFASIKLITSLVPPDVYGEANLVLGVLAFLSSLLVGPFNTAHARLYFDYVERGMEGWYWRVMLRLLGGMVAVTWILYLGVAVANALTGNMIYVRLTGAAMVVLLVQPYYSAMMSYFEAKRWQRRAAVTGLLYRLSNAANLVFLLFLLPAVQAIVLAQGIAALVLLAVSGPAWRRMGVGRGAEPGELTGLIRSMGKLGWMLSLGWMVQWVLTMGDRYLIDYYMTPGDVGIYGMNYGLWAAPYAILNGWLEVLTRPVLYAKAAKEEWQEVRGVIVKRTVIGAILSAVGTLILYGWGDVIGRMMLGERYWIGSSLMMPLAVGHCFFVVGYSIAALFLSLKRPGLLILGSGIAATANILLNIFLIPRHGLVGAGLATLYSYLLWALVLALIAYWVMRRPMGKSACAVL